MLLTAILFCLIMPLLRAVDEPQSPNKLMSTVLSGDYDNSVAPNYPRAVNVSIDMSVTSVSLGEKRMEVTTEMYFILNWSDRRLQLPRQPNFLAFSIPAKYHTRLWLPDVTFTNARVRTHDEPVRQSLIRLYPEGDLYYSRRLTVVSECRLDYRRYPNDIQSCDINIESYAKTMDDMYMTFRSEARVVTSGGFTLKSGLRTMMDELKTKQVKEHLATGTYQRLSVTMTFSSGSGYVIRQTIAPTLVLVLFTYLSFVIGRRHLAIRFGFLALLGLLMGITVLNANVVVEQPRVNQMTYVDVYYVFAYAMYLGAILHFLAALFLLQETNTEKGGTTHTAAPLSNAARLCDLAGILWYPLAFVVFNIIFFVKCFS